MKSGSSTIHLFPYGLEGRKGHNMKHMSLSANSTYYAISARLSETMHFYKQRRSDWDHNPSLAWNASWNVGADYFSKQDVVIDLNDWLDVLLKIKNLKKSKQGKTVN